MEACTIMLWMGPICTDLKHEVGLEVIKQRTAMSSERTNTHNTFRSEDFLDDISVPGPIAAASGHCVAHKDSIKAVLFVFVMTNVPTTLAGALLAEGVARGLDDVSDYALLASSGCYRLSGRPFSNDVNMDNLHPSMKMLGFKPKHIPSIFSPLVASLLTGNITFFDYSTIKIPYESARVANSVILKRVCGLLGVEPKGLERTLTNKTNYVRKELHTVVLASLPAAVRDRLVQYLYSILFAFIVETANHHTAPSLSESTPPCTQIVLFDQPSFQSRSRAGSCYERRSVSLGNIWHND